MERFTISLDEELAGRFDGLITRQGYVNRSEAVRDLIRLRLAEEELGADKSAWCVANVNYIYDHHDHVAAGRLTGLQHEHHDLVVSSLHVHLDHDHCMETVVLRGPVAAVRSCAQELIALRGVRHGNVHLVALTRTDSHKHAHSPGAHRHLKPVS